MSTAAHITGLFVREQCPFATYSTYLMSKQSSHPLNYSCSYSMCTILPIPQWRIQDFKERGFSSNSVLPCQRYRTDVRSSDPSARSAEKKIRLHFSLFRMGSRGTFTLCIAI